MREKKREKTLEQDYQTLYSSIHSMLEGNLEVLLMRTKLLLSYILQKISIKLLRN